MTSPPTSNGDLPRKAASTTDVVNGEHFFSACGALLLFDFRSSSKFYFLALAVVGVDASRAGELFLKTIRFVRRL